MAGQQTRVDGFVGSGIAFPMGLDAIGAVALSSGHDEVEEAIQLILGTAPGERPMRPEFGCGIHDYVFAEADGATAGRLAQQVKLALLRWEPRITVESVDVTVADVTSSGELMDSGDERNCLLIDIHYSVRGTNDPRNLVFPFYVIPGEPA